MAPNSGVEKRITPPSSSVKRKEKYIWSSSEKIGTFGPKLNEHKIVIAKYWECLLQMQKGAL